MPSPFLSLFDVPVPVNQLEALPLISQTKFVSGGVYGTVLFGTVLKYWDTSATGINGLAPQLFDTKYQLTTPWLDVSPCKFFAFVILRHIPNLDIGVAPRAATLMVQYRQSPTDTPPLSRTIGLGINDQLTGFYNLTSSGDLGFTAEAGPAIQRVSILVSPNSSLGTSGQVAPVCIGPGVRFQMNWSTNPPNAGDNSVYSMAIWGSS